VVAALHDARLFRLLLPEWLGGGEGTPTDYVRLVEIVSRADASTGWVLSQTIVAGIAAFYLSPEVATEIFGPADAVLAWGSSPTPVTATAVAGGFRVSGAWSFGSGCRQASWLGGHCSIVDAAGGALGERTLLFPKTAVRLVDRWHVVGLRGTASDSYVADDLFVPAEHAITSMYRWPDCERQKLGVTCRFGATALYAPGIAAVAVGNACGLLAAIIDLAKRKTPRTAAAPLGESEVVQVTIAEAATRLDASWAYLIETLNEAETGAMREGEVPLEARMRLRAASTFAILGTGDAVTALYRIAGTTAIFEDDVYERGLRDAFTLSQQIQSRANHYATIGRHLLGLDVDMRWV
jgi:alkylation response protein AidB-like acyl-CoA dehydrogenase